MEILKHLIVLCCGHMKERIKMKYNGKYNLGYRLFAKKRKVNQKSLLEVLLLEDAFAYEANIKSILTPSCKHKVGNGKNIDCYLESVRIGFEVKAEVVAVAAQLLALDDFETLTFDGTSLTMVLTQNAIKGENGDLKELIVKGVLADASIPDILKEVQTTLATNSKFKTSVGATSAQGTWNLKTWRWPAGTGFAPPRGKTNRIGNSVIENVPIMNNKSIIKRIPISGSALGKVYYSRGCHYIVVGDGGTGGNIFKTTDHDPLSLGATLYQGGNYESQMKFKGYGKDTRITFQTQPTGPKPTHVSSVKFLTFEEFGNLINPKVEELIKSENEQSQKELSLPPVSASPWTSEEEGIVPRSTTPIQYK